MLSLIFDLTILIEFDILRQSLPLIPCKKSLMSYITLKVSLVALAGVNFYLDILEAFCHFPQVLTILGVELYNLLLALTASCELDDVSRKEAEYIISTLQRTDK